MKDKIIRIFTDEEKSFVDNLITLGMRRIVANVLAYLFLVGEGTSYDIEMATGMRQPETSIALKEIKKWTTATRIPNTHRSMIALGVPFMDVVNAYHDKLLVIRETQDAAYARIGQLVD